MYAMSLWNKASEIASSFKKGANGDEEEKSEIERIKWENEKLKEEVELKEKKYQSLMNEIAQKESQLPKSENEYENLYIKICKYFKNFILTFFTEEQMVIDKINEVFINPNTENFFEKVYQITKYIRFKAFFDLFTSQREKLGYYISKEKLDTIAAYAAIIQTDNSKDIYTNEDPCDIMSDILTELYKRIESGEEGNAGYKEKLDGYEEKFTLLNENISRMQEDCRKAVDIEQKLNEIINNIESEKNNIKEKNEYLLKEISQLKEEINNNDIQKTQMNKDIAKYTEEREKMQKVNEELNSKVNMFLDEMQKLQRDNEELKRDIELYSENNDAINEKNEIISKKNAEIENLIASYKFLEESKNNFEKEKKEEVELYKNKILEMSNEITKLNEVINRNSLKESIEKIYIDKIQLYESQIEKVESENIELKKKEVENKKNMENLVKKVNNDLKDTEFLIDKRVISSVLVNYFDKNANSKIKESLLETLSNIMEYSNDDRKKMGLKPISIPSNGKKEEDKFKKVSEGLYNFILNS